MRLPDGKTAILYSVYEAVSNSIHAINDRFTEAKAASKGKVDVDIALDENGDIASISITDQWNWFHPGKYPFIRDQRQPLQISAGWQGRRTLHLD
jgi:hypothetical protein